MEQQNNADDELARHFKLMGHVTTFAGHVTTFAAHVTQLRLKINELNYVVETLTELMNNHEQRIKRLEEQQHGRESTDDAGTGHRRDHPGGDRVELGG